MNGKCCFIKASLGGGSPAYPRPFQETFPRVAGMEVSEPFVTTPPMVDNVLAMLHLVITMLYHGDPTISPTWIQVRDSENNIIISKLMSEKEVFSYPINKKLLITSGNAGNIIVKIGDEIKGKLGGKGEVIDSIIISSDFFPN